MVERGGAGVGREVEGGKVPFGEVPFVGALREGWDSGAVGVGTSVAMQGGGARAGATRRCRGVGRGRCEGEAGHSCAERQLSTVMKLAT